MGDMEPAKSAPVPTMQRTPGPRPCRTVHPSTDYIRQPCEVARATQRALQRHDVLPPASCRETWPRAADLRPPAAAPGPPGPRPPGPCTPAHITSACSCSRGGRGGGSGELCESAASHNDREQDQGPCKSILPPLKDPCVRVHGEGGFRGPAPVKALMQARIGREQELAPPHRRMACQWVPSHR